MKFCGTKIFDIPGIYTRFCSIGIKDEREEQL